MTLYHGVTTGIGPGAAARHVVGHVGGIERGSWWSTSPGAPALIQAQDF